MLSVDEEFLRVSPASQPRLQCFLCFATLSWDPSVLRGPLAGLCSPSPYPHLLPIHSALLTLSGCLVTFLAQAAKTKFHEPGDLGTEIKSLFWGLRSLKLGYQVLFLGRLSVSQSTSSLSRVLMGSIRLSLTRAHLQTPPAQRFKLQAHSRGDSSVVG